MLRGQRSSLWGRIWNDPVWSAVISASIIAVSAGVGSYLLNWWPLLGQFFAQGLALAKSSSCVPNWLLAIIYLFALPSAVLLILLLWRLVMPFKSDTQGWEYYVSDVFFGLRWRWHYNGSTMSDLTTFCPYCDYQVFPDNVSSYSFFDRIAFSCDSCQADLGTFDESFDSLEYKARRFAQQKIRNGTWHTHNAD